MWIDKSNIPNGHATRMQRRITPLQRYCNDGCDVAPRSLPNGSEQWRFVEQTSTKRQFQDIYWTPASHRPEPEHQWISCLQYIWDSWVMLGQNQTVLMVKYIYNIVNYSALVTRHTTAKCDQTSNRRQPDVNFKSSNRRRFDAGLTSCTERWNTKTR